MLARPRDARMTATKIIHDYNLKCVARPIVKVYYDIETAMFNNNKNQVPEYHDRNAFITVICLTICLPDGKVIKRALVNNHLAYETDGVALDIDLQKFNTETEMCQSFFRIVNELSEGNQVICIGHNASTNPRGQPYDLPWLVNRSQYNLQVIQKPYRDMYSGTEGSVIQGIHQFPGVYFYDTIRAIGQLLSLQKKKIPSLSLDALCAHFNVAGKKGDMTYKELASLSVQYGADFSAAINYCM
jgi:hypothetical protein